MKVILPGSYDPITIGHLDIIKRAAENYAEVYVVIFINPEKKYTFSEEERLRMISLATDGIEGVKVDSYSGRVVDYMKEKGIDKIIKGYRNDTDLEYERVQADYNFLHGGYPTEFYRSSLGFEEVSSTATRQLIKSGGDFEAYLPHSVAQYIKSKKI